ncbi:MAG TPA: menaquinone biosynthesis protein [Chthoniobacterales bacterium]
MLRIGCVKYLNARPLIHGWPEPVVLDHPAVLCRKLAGGELDVALVSSFEFLRRPVYRIVDGVSISSDGPVYSVVVACTGERPASEIELDPASETSVALLQHLMSERGEVFQGVQIATDLLSPIQSGRARLLIGDQAIRFRQKFGASYRYLDLGEEWRCIRQLPFVYALWLLRPEVTNIETLGEQLRALRDQNLQKIEQIIGQEKSFEPAFCRRYYRDNLRFSLGDREKQGLQQFANACAKLNLIPERELDLQLV